jgi:PAS domain S-box-containing protein
MESLSILIERFLLKTSKKMQSQRTEMAKFQLFCIKLFFIFAILIQAVSINASTNSEKDLQVTIGEQTKEKASADFRFKKEILSSFIQQIEDKVQALASSRFTLDYAKNKTVINQENLSQLFYIVASGNDSFMQIRFLDVQGWEKVRIDRPQSGSLPVQIKNEALQNKGKRDYFISIKSTPSGHLWHSRFDLNMERGKIEQPFNPTFRVGTPVIIENQVKGIIIVNLRLAPVLNILRNSTRFDIYMIDQKGNYIIHPDSNKEWSRYFPEKGQVLDTFPDTAHQILQEDTYFKGPYAFTISQGLSNSETLRLIFAPKKEKKDSIPDILKLWQEIRFEIKLGILFVCLSAGVILGLFFFWNRKLVKEIEDKKQAERRLLENERKTRAMSEAIHDALIMTDAQARILYWNQSAEKLFGRSAAEAIGQDMHKLLVPVEYHENAKAGLKVFSKTGQGPVVGNLQELTAIGRDNQSFPAEIAVSSFQVEKDWYAVGTIRDITERKQMENRLRESEHRIKTILNSIKTGIIVINPQNRTIVEINPIAAEMIGLPSDEIVGKTCHRFICPRKHETCPIIDLEEKVDNQEGVLLTANGGEIPILKTVVPVDLGGEKHLLESFVDLTGRKTAEEELKEKMAELERFNQLTINREERMIELKEEINQLCIQMGNSPKYKIVE